MTTLEAPRDTDLLAEPPPGYWQREASHNPRPLTPLGSSVFLSGLNQSFPKVFADFGLLVETIEWREIRGYVYNHVKPYGVPDRPAGRTPPKPVLWLVLRLLPTFRKRIARCKEALREELDRRLIDRWFDEWRPGLVRDIARLREVDLVSLSDAQLADQMEELRLWTFASFDIHFYLSGANGLPLARLAWFCRDALGYDDMATMALMSGLSSASSEPALALAALADGIRGDASLKDVVLGAAPAGVVALLRERGGDAASALDDYLRRYGCRALRYELIERTLGEDVALVGQLLQEQVRRPVDLLAEQQRLRTERQAARAAALAALADEAARSGFAALADAAERAYPVREDNEFFTVSVPLALCRFAALEAAGRLISGRAIRQADDVFFLTWDEVLGSLRGGSRVAAEVIAARRDRYAAAGAYDAPSSFGQEPPPPPLDVLPREAREAMEGMLYIQQRVFEAELSAVRADAGAREVRGAAASRGSYTGTARVVMGEHEFDKLQPGDVLVCPITSPVWSILFANIGALVTDSGGILSHPAIIAREYGIPAVVATGNGSQIIRDGQRVVVDGDNGLVRIIA